MSRDLINVGLTALALMLSAGARAQPSVDGDRPGCEMPSASDHAKVLLVTIGGGEGLSTTTIATQEARVSTAAISIEPGSEPLYVVVSSEDAAIWRMSGAIDRVERIVLATLASERGGTSSPPLAGITGISPDRITFLKLPRCLEYFVDAPSTASAISAAIVKRYTGKAPVIIAGRVTAAEIVLPSGVFKTEWKGDLPDTIDKTSQSAINAVLAYPAGIVEIEPATVTATAPTERYKILPGWFGLLQLERDGVVQWNRSRELIIRKQMRFPGGLYGSDSARFFLPQGVPEPEGIPGHSCVYSEEKNAFIMGFACRPRS